MTGMRLNVFVALLAGQVISGAQFPAFAQDGLAGAVIPVIKLAEITITANNKIIRGELSDTPTSRDFLGQLPLTLPMTRLREREYYGRPTMPLSTEGKKRDGFDNGDIGYTARSGYLAVFFDNSKDPDITDLIVIGKVTSDLSDFRDVAQTVDMKIERSDVD